MIKSEPELDRIKDRMFVRLEAREQQQNRRQCLVVNPEILQILFSSCRSQPVQQKVTKWSTQLALLQQLSEVYRSNPSSSVLLWRRDCEIASHGISILDDLIEFLFGLEVDRRQTPRIAELFQPFVARYVLNCRNFKKLTTLLAREFYDGRFLPARLSLVTQLLKKCFVSQLPKDGPSSYFLMYGEGSGIKMLREKALWGFNRGFSLHLSFVVDSTDQHGELMYIRVKDCDFSLAVNSESRLVVKVFGETQQIDIEAIEVGCWYYLRLDYVLKSKLFTKSFILRLWLNDKLYEREQLPIPQIHQQDELSELLFGRDFHGRINCIALSRQTENPELFGRNSQFWLGDWQQIESLLRCNRSLYQNLYLLYVPFILTEVNDRKVVFELTSRNHGELQENTAVWCAGKRCVSTHGGMFNLLPLFYLMRFYQYDTYPELLQELLDIVRIVFTAGYTDVQEQSLNCMFFEVVGAHLSEVDCRWVTVKAIELLAAIKDQIIEPRLKEQFFRGLLWKFKLKEIKALAVVRELMQLIKSFYVNDPRFCLQLWNMQHCLHYLEQNFEPMKAEVCCREHYEQFRLQHNFEEDGKVIDLYQRVEPVFQVTLLVAKLHLEENLPEGFKMIEQILHFMICEHSNCYTKLLVKLLSGIYQLDTRQVKERMVKQCRMLCYMNLLLNRSNSYDMLQAVVELLALVHNNDKEQVPRVLYMIAAHFKKLNLNSNHNAKVSRSISESCSSPLRTGKVVRRQSLSLTTEQQLTVQSVDVLAQRIRLRKKNLSNHRPLMTAVMSIVVKQMYGQELQHTIPEELHLNDQAMIMLLQYHQQCCLLFRKEIILTVWAAVVGASPELKDEMRNNYYFMQYFLLRTLVNSYLDRQLQLEDLRQMEHHILQVFKTLALTTVDNPEEFSWLFLRVQSLLVTVRKDIESTIEEDRRPQVMFICRYVLRRFLVVLIASKEFCTHAQPLMGMAFAVYSCVFCEEKEHQTAVAEGLLEYFALVEKELFMVEGHALPEICLSEFPDSDGAVLIDLKLIEAYVGQFELNRYKLPDDQTSYNKIAMYLDPSFSEEFAALKATLFREVDFSGEQPSRSEFLDFFESLFQRSMIDDKTEQEQQMKQLVIQKKVLVIETMVLMLELSLEYCLRKVLAQAFERLLQQLQHCLKITVLVCQNSGVSSKQSARDEKQIVRKLVLQVLHCLYNLMENEKPIHYNELMEASIARIFHFLYANIDILNQKMGNVATFEDALHFGGIIKSVERYNLVLIELFDKHVRDEHKNRLISLSHIKEIRYLERERLLEEVLSPRYTVFFKKGKFVTRLLTAEIQREIREVQNQFRGMYARQSIETKLKLTQENFGYELSSEVATISSQALAAFNRSQVLFLREQNLHYRQSMYSWNKIWKRLRLYQYPWSVWLNQKEDLGWSWETRHKKNLYIRRKFSKFESQTGTRPFLSVQLEEPWHVKKANIQREIEYMNKDYHYNFHRGNSTEEKHQHRNNWLKMFRRQSPPEQNEFRVEWIKNNTKRRGLLKLLDTKLQFSYESIYQKDSHLDFTHFRLGEFKPLQKVWELTQLREVSRRRYLMKYQCLLLELENNTSEIFNFVDERMELFLQFLSRKQKSRVEDRHLLKLNNIRFYTEKFRYELEDEQHWLNQLTEDWQHRRLSNFQYLLLLNKAAGRSYYDPTQYPVFPWIISDYTCKEMVYRPLDKTMGALGNESRRELIREKAKNFDPFNPVPLYQYGTHYSSPGVIFNYLIRLSPYTEAARTLQGGRFDISDRIFYSLLWCWRSATSEMSDVRELCPQFFYMPEFLLNLEYYNFGVTQQKERVHNVQLPLWAEGDPYTFIALHRRAFESEEVSLMIHHWLDLIFGYKQKGKEAEESLNLYYYLTYEDSVNLDEIEDEVSKTSAEAQIIHFGQTPCQLFEKPHPRRDELPKRIWLLQHPKCELFSPQLKTADWSDISSQGKPQQPILALQLRGNQLEVLKCNALLQFTVGTGEPILLSERLLNFKKTKNEIHLTDLTFGNRVHFFGGKFLVTAFSLNGELRIYHTESANLVETQKGSVKNCIYINEAENLILTGGRDHLFEVYELVRHDKEHLELVSIATETLLDPINHISEGSGFYSVCAGHFVSIYSISRSAAFVNHKHKKVRCKFIRSFQCKNKVVSARIFGSPLAGVAFHDSSTLWTYSANGQFLASRTISLKLEPQLVRDSNFMDMLLCLEESQMTLLNTPTLSVVRCVSLPNNRVWTYWRWLPDTVLLGTSAGQVVMVTEDTTATSTAPTAVSTTMTVVASVANN